LEAKEKGHRSEIKETSRLITKVLSILPKQRTKEKNSYVDSNYRKAMPLAPTNETKQSDLHELFWQEKHLNQQEIKLIKLS
jgi:hypothetical protein